MHQPPRIHLFQGYGVELEYMLVDRDSLEIKPITDDLIKHQVGSYVSDYENGMVTWSNELVLHVVELKSTRPEHNFTALESEFQSNIARINAILSGWNAMLMPTAAHPFMDPAKETRLWPHENNAVYDIYNKIFDCRGHGWSNLQSTHLNLPFYDDEEFARLHAAVRLILPVLPALCASSPMLDGKYTGMLDTRLKYYKSNQAKIPSITGRVIPEAVFSRRNYLNTIYERIKNDIAPFDPTGELNPIWVNSRGAIPRFDRGSIEIRLMDIQECPAADLAVITLVVEVVKALANNKFIDLEMQMRWKTDALAAILEKTMTRGQDAELDNAEFLAAFGMTAKTATARDLWRHLLGWVETRSNSAVQHWRPQLEVLVNQGTLASRIVSSMGPQPTRDRILATYRKLAACLDQNKMFFD
jgi:carboxylate-amine ligase